MNHGKNSSIHQYLIPFKLLDYEYKIAERYHSLWFGKLWRYDQKKVRGYYPTTESKFGQKSILTCRFRSILAFEFCSVIP